MTTFSQLVDEITADALRPNMKSQIATYLNQTLLELHSDPEQRKPVFYRDNLREDVVYANSDAGLNWDIPNVATWQEMKFVAYLSVHRGNRPITPSEAVPSRAMNAMREFYYRSGNKYFFKGYGGAGSAVALAYYERTPSLTYYIPAERPATYDPITGWSYAPVNNTDELKQLARDRTSNWLLLRWSPYIAEGVKAKLYKRLADNDRARLCYSLYQEYRQSLVSAETVSLGVFG